MQNQYKKISRIFIIVFTLSVLHYTFIVIPNFQEIVEIDSQLWNEFSSFDIVKRVAYYFGYLFPFAISICWLLKSYFKPENRLKRVGFRKEVTSLKNLLLLNSITKEEYSIKLLELEASYKDLKKDDDKKLSSEKSMAQLNLEYQSLKALKERGVLSQEEFEHKMTKLKLEQTEYDIETLERFVKKYDFQNQNLEEFLSEQFTPLMSARSSKELISVLKSDGYKLSAKYQAYIELKNRDNRNA